MEEVILGIIVDIVGDKSITLSTDFIDEEIFDSMEMLRIIVELEHTFNVKICVQKLNIESLRNISKIVELLSDKSIMED